MEDKGRIQWFAAKYANAHDVFFIGRGIDYAVGLEGSLKLKEISYIHSEAYAAGELKHGTISLIENGTLVIGILTQSELYEKTISNMVECKSRGAYLMGLTTFGKYETEDHTDFTVYVPKVDEHFVGSLAVIPLQLLELICLVGPMRHVEPMCPNTPPSLLTSTHWLLPPTTSGICGSTESSTIFLRF